MHLCKMHRATFDCHLRVKLKFMRMIRSTHPYPPILSNVPKMNITGWIHNAFISTTIHAVETTVQHHDTDCLCSNWHQIARRLNGYRWSGLHALFVLTGADHCFCKVEMVEFLMHCCCDGGSGHMRALGLSQTGAGHIWDAAY